MGLPYSSDPPRSPRSEFMRESLSRRANKFVRIIGERATTKVFVKERCRILAYVYSYAGEREQGAREGEEKGVRGEWYVGPWVLSSDKL